MVNIFTCSTTELKSLVEYKSVLEKEKRFPKDFWSPEKKQPDGARPISRILCRYCIENVAGIEPARLPEYNLKQIKEILVRYRLFGMVQGIFNHNILAILRNAYPEEFKMRRFKDWMWSKHGIWNNEKAIIEAVQDMVYKEGIRRTEDIPQFDWKKRLIRHGIYNVLSYFGWSIYSLFNFVYPGKFHPADFKFKTKWKASESLEYAFYFMQKTFRKNYTDEQIMLLSTSDFRRLGLAGMLISLFGCSTLQAKEYYLYKTIGNEKHQAEIKASIEKLLERKQDNAILKRLKEVARGRNIYNLHSNYTLYGYIKRHAKSKNMSISDFIESYGFVYKSARKDTAQIDKDDIWKLRKQGLTYVQIAGKLGSNPTTISEMCNRHFGGDPLIPRPIEEYTTVQELMDQYHIDHKTIMKLVFENNFENHTTIRFRYLKKSEIIPEIEKYISQSSHHKFMVNRYAN